MLDERLYQDLERDPGLFGKSLADLSARTWVVVDEIQRLRVVRRILVHPAARSFRTSDGIEIWTLQRFHEALAKAALWP